jgi:hypothetical protein
LDRAFFMSCKPDHRIEDLWSISAFGMPILWNILGLFVRMVNISQ